MIENLVKKLTSSDDAEEQAEIQKKIEDTIGAEAFAQFMDRRRKARIRNIAIAVGASAAVIGTAIWIATKPSDDVEDEIADETTED